MKIFISYRQADSTYLIGRIKDRQEAAFGKQSVFWDLDDIPAPKLSINAIEIIRKMLIM